MRVIGLTGSIACGKSTVSRELIRRGFPVIDGDSLSRELTGPGGAAVEDIRSAFGDHYITSDGSMDRRGMGKLVFSDPSARERLDRVMSRHIRTLTLQRIDEARAAGSKLCFLDMPLLYEKGYDRYCDTVWCVWIPEDLQLRRLIDRDSLSYDEAMARIRAVISSDEKADLSPVVIDNTGSIKDTLLQVSAQLDKELSRTAVTRRRRHEHGAPVPGTVQPVLQPNRPVPSDPSGIERPDSVRRKPSSRKAAWQMPKWIMAALVSAAVVLAVSFTAQMLMNAYLTRQHDLHAAEQKAVDEKYPLVYSDLIVKISGEYHLSPSLIAAVILNESSFRADARSSVGARGLMQLMPDTAEWIAHKLRIDNYSFEQMSDPETNIRFGCWYLNYLSSLFNGDPLCVVCAYHAGQGEIASWLSNPLYSSNGTTLILDQLPEGPTRQYAGRVTRDYGIYLAKYFTKSDRSVTSDPASDS